MARYNILLEVPENLDVSDSEIVSPGVQWEISQLEAFWPKFIVPQTQITVTKKLIHAIITTDIVDVETFVRSLIIGYELDWIILGLKTWSTTEPIIEWSEELQEDIITGYEAKFFVLLDIIAIAPYLNSRYLYDEDGDIIDEQVKDISWLHQYQGMAPWM